MPAEGLLVFDSDTRSFWFRQSGQWTELISSASGLRDSDNDTRVTVEQSLDEDTIRFAVAGSEFATMDGKSLSMGSDGGSVYIGQGAGENALDSIAGNVIAGKNAGSQLVQGHSNTFMGNHAGHQSVNGFLNVAVGDSALSQETSQFGITAVGAEAGMFSIGASRNTFIGYQSGKYASTGNSTFVGVAAGLLTTGSNNTILGHGAGTDSLSGHSNTFVGVSSGRHGTGASRNTFVGVSSGRENISGGGNTLIGNSAGKNNDGSFNVAIGDSAMIFSEFVSGMVAIGHAAGKSATGNYNTYIGEFAGSNASQGSINTFVGYKAGQNTTANFNTFIGANAGGESSEGQANTFVGSSAGLLNASGEFNTFLGLQAGFLNKNGIRNTFVGAGSGGGYGSTADTTGGRNTFVGVNSGSRISTGERNIFIGDGTGYYNTSGSRNTFLGEDAGIENTIGHNNTYVGQAAGYHSTGSGNVFLGQYSGYFETGNGKLYIDNDSVTTPLIYGDFNSNFATVHGDLGINVVNPDRELVVFDSDNDGDSAIKLEATNGSSREMLIAVNQSSGGFISMATNNNLAFRTNGATRMTIENSGDVGIGVADPSSRLEVSGEDNDGSIATLRIISGSQHMLLDGNEIDSGSDLHLQHNTSNNIVLGSGGGNVGIRTISPEYPLHIEANGSFGVQTIGMVIESATSKRPIILFSENASGLDLNDGMSIEYDGSTSGNELNINVVGGAPALTIESSSGEVGIGTTNPSALLEVAATTVKKTAGGSWTASSDRRLKQDVLDYKEGLEELLQIRPVLFRYNDISGYNTTEQHIGVIAQELEKITPHMVSTYDRDGTDYLQVDNSAMTYMLINAVKEQQVLIEKLIAQNTSLITRMAALEVSNLSAQILEVSDNASHK